MAKDKEEFKNFFDGNDTAEGFQDINQDSMAIPFVKIAQLLSPAMKKNKAEYIPSLKEGEFYNSVTKEIYGKKLEIVVGKFERVYTEWLPDRGGFVGYHSPEAAEDMATDTTFGKWKHGENLLQENYVYYVVIVGHEHEGVMIMSLSSSQIKKAKAWNRQLTTTTMPDKSGKALPYYLRWTMESCEEHDDKNDWYGLTVTFIGFINEEQYTIVREERKALPDKKVDFAQLENRSNTIEDSEDETVEY